MLDVWIRNDCQLEIGGKKYIKNKMRHHPPTKDQNRNKYQNSKHIKYKYTSLIKNLNYDIQNNFTRSYTHNWILSSPCCKAWKKTNKKRMKKIKKKIIIKMKENRIRLINYKFLFFSKDSEIQKCRVTWCGILNGVVTRQRSTSTAH